MFDKKILLGMLFHDLGPLTLNFLDLSLCLLGTTSFDLADLILCFSSRLAIGTRLPVNYVRSSSDQHLYVFGEHS